MKASDPSGSGGLPVPAFARSNAPPAATPTVRVGQRRRFWQKLRFWGASMALSSAMAACVVAWKRGQQMRIVVINDADERLPPLTLMAAGQTHAVPALAAEESHRWLVDAAPGSGPVTLRSVRTEAAVEWLWEGELPAVGGGHRILLHLLPDGVVEADLQLSLWAALPVTD